MISSIAIAAAEGFERGQKLPLTDEIAAKSGDAPRDRQHRGRTPPPDDLEERIGSKLIFSINELAALADRSPATIFRLLRLGLLPFVWVGSSRCFTRAVVLNFLRHGTRRSETT
jgi:hypothetical protein